VTRDEALAVHRAHGQRARDLTTKRVLELRAMWLRSQSNLSPVSRNGGPRTRDELTSAILQEEYPPELLNEATHYAHHAHPGNPESDWVSTSCVHCAAAAGDGSPRA
jgi:hypothetical protein